jgi:serine phosphatase RsbU (regulator of sigma subunit)/anti-sigma regulatory factor (Ser/Thr protein kinase)
MEIRLLAVDDEKFNLLLLQEALKNEGIKIDTCGSADKAIELIKENDYDVALLDVIMPGIDGFELRKLVREHDSRLPIIYLTAIVDTLDNDLIERISEDKFTYYMKKPFVREDLVKQIHSAVESRRSEDETHKYYTGLEKDLSLAAEVQRLLIPDWLRLEEDVLVSSIYQPSQKVSGDIFDIIKLDSGKYFMFIGDIAGHGIQAALYMSAVQSLIKMIIGLGRDKIDTCAILNRLNWIFCTELGEDNYMTCIVAVFDFNKNKLEFFSAGHPSIFEYNSKNDKIRILNPKNKGGIPVGWDRNYEYKKEDAVKVSFEDDSVFFAATDGSFEISNQDGEMLGMDKMLQLLESIAPSEDSAVIPYRVREALPQMGYESADDDICLISIKKLEKNPEGKKRLIRCISPMISEVNNLCMECEAFVTKHTQNVELAVKVELLLGEFLNNVIIHGLNNRQQARPGVLVDMLISDDKVELVILDKGKKWTFSTKPATITEEIWDEHDKFATSGRGMSIIRSIACNIRRNRYNELNETIFLIEPEEAK